MTENFFLIEGVSGKLISEQNKFENLSKNFEDLTQKIHNFIKGKMYYDKVFEETDIQKQNMKSILKQYQKILDLLEKYSTIQKNLENYNLLEAVHIFQNIRKKSNNTLNIHKFSVLEKTLDKECEQVVQQYARAYMIKNIKFLFTTMKRYSDVLEMTLNHKQEQEQVDFYSVIQLFQKVKNIFMLIGLSQELERKTYETMYDFFTNALVKNIENKNIEKKFIDIFCFFSVYQKFNLEVFDQNLKEIKILKAEPKFIKYINQKIDSLDFEQNVKLISLESKLIQLYDICQLEQCYLIFEEILNNTVQCYIQKCVQNQYEKINIHKSKYLDNFQIKSLEQYKELIDLGFVLEEYSHKANCAEYLQEQFQPQESWIKFIFYKYAKTIQDFIKIFDQDVFLEKELKDLSGFRYYGVEYINSLMLNQLAVFFADELFDFNQLIGAYYNLLQFKKTIIKRYLTENFYMNKELSNKFDKTLNIIYEKILFVIQRDAELSVYYFFEKKNKNSFTDFMGKMFDSKNILICRQNEMEGIVLSIGAIIDKNLGEQILNQIINKEKYINIVTIKEIYQQLNNVILMFKDYSKGIQGKIFIMVQEVQKFFRVFLNSEYQQIEDPEYFDKRFQFIKKNQIISILKKFQEVKNFDSPKITKKEIKNLLKKIS